MRHKETIGLFDYWNEIRGNRDAPLRSEISPAALGRLLPSVMLLERRADGEVVFRLAGTRICSLRCREIKGRPLTNIFRDEDRNALKKVLDSVERDNALAVLDTFADKGDGASVPVEVALFPLVDETTRILGIASFKTPPYWLGAEPARLELRGIRYIDARSDLPFLRSRPAVPVGNRAATSEPTVRDRLRLLSGGPAKPKAALRIFTIHEGGKK
ncbi:MAG: PAS domain-containing protein [Oricola sp.]